MRYSKLELVNRVSEATGKTKSETKHILDVAFIMIQSLTSGDDVLAIHDFGVFKTRTRVARAGRNPQDGSVIQIAESASMVFKATKHK